ncbi:MAG: hypothetical protein ACRCZD_16075 [Phycicoccus sp.]
MPVRAAAVALAAAGLSAMGTVPAGAAPAEADVGFCGSPGIVKKYPWDSTGRLVHSCAGGTVTYSIDCLLTPDVNYSVSFPPDGLSVYKFVSCGKEPNTILGVSNWTLV